MLDLFRNRIVREYSDEELSVHLPKLVVIKLIQANMSVRIGILLLVFRPDRLEHLCARHHFGHIFHDSYKTLRRFFRLLHASALLKKVSLELFLTTEPLAQKHWKPHRLSS